MASYTFSSVGAGKERRTRRVIGSDGHSLVVALDHAGFMASGPPLAAMAQIAEGRPDAVLTTWHTARANAETFAEGGLVLRVDGGYTELGSFAPNDVSTLLTQVEDAMILGADMLIIMGFPGMTEEHVTMHRLSHLVTECEKVGMPLMVEALPGGFGAEIPQTIESIASTARIVAEMGADVIKTACPGDPAEFAAVVEACPVPVVALGGPKVDNEDDIVAFAKGVVDAGAAGVAIGRNVWGSPDPAKLVARLREAVHG
jgi:class I fructose-bisphosphate aldolase/fructose-bisphosphate aldolase/2-amino-3,7-dideoxy-D-threo-hept-6-ulosonate synthase